jgi:hypothetical protein
MNSSLYDNYVKLITDSLSNDSMCSRLCYSLITIQSQILTRTQVKI